MSKCANQVVKRYVGCLEIEDSYQFLPVLGNQVVRQTIRIRDESDPFVGKTFDEGLGLILETLSDAEPLLVQKFREAFRPELWYGRSTWSNQLDK